jgi:hypothetical protein
VLKTFALPDSAGNDPVKLSAIVVEPMGRATAQGSRITLPTPFVVSTGAVLDLSPWYRQLMQNEKKAAVLRAK